MNEGGAAPDVKPEWWDKTWVRYAEYADRCMILHVALRKIVENPRVVDGRQLWGISEIQLYNICIFPLPEGKTDPSFVSNVHHRSMIRLQCIADMTLEEAHETFNRLENELLERLTSLEGDP